MTVFVFLGPSLPLERARRELPAATFLPPAQRGDVYRLVANRQPTAIGLVDGLFDTVPAVVHKEILFALSQGVHVLGAASMGALRAAELWPYGMEGIGRIFERLRSEEWEADDEVAVAHGTAETGFRPCSVALATLRLGLEDAREAGYVSHETVAALSAAAQRQFYPDRSWEALYALGKEAGVADEELAALRSFVAHREPDAKRDDALALLARLQELTAAKLEPYAADFDFERTMHWQRIVSECGAISPTGNGQEARGVSHAELARHARMRPEGPEWMRGAVLLHLLGQEARRRAESFTRDELVAALSRFRRRNRLLTAEQTRTWMTAQSLNDQDLMRLMELDLVLATLLHEAPGSIRSMLALELKRAGAFGSAIAEIGHKRELLEERGVVSLTLEDAGVSFEDLLAWYQAGRESIEGSLESHAQWLGFASARELLSELLLEYVSTGPAAKPQSTA